jgi:hypothetical protein
MWMRAALSAVLVISALTCSSSHIRADEIPGTWNGGSLVGWEMTYTVHLSGKRIGKQRVRMVTHDGDIRIDGQFKTTGFARLFFRMDENWDIDVNGGEFFPVHVERKIKRKKDRQHYTYSINPAQEIVHAYDKVKGRKSTFKTRNVVLDQFTLLYYYRHNREKLGATVTFDLLEKMDLRTVVLENNGRVRINAAPTKKRPREVDAIHYGVKSGRPLDVYLDPDTLVPFKIIFTTKMNEKNKQRTLVLFLRSLKRI